MWSTITAGVVRTIGRRTPLYNAAVRARLGKDPRGEKFAALAARLPADDRRRLWNHVEQLETARAKALRAA
jgi:hypothetical protein